MAGLASNPMMRDLTPATADQTVSLGPMDDWARNLKTKGDADPFNPQHVPAIQRITDSIRSGNISEEGVKNLANLTPKSAFVLYDALNEYKKSSDRQSAEKSILSQNFGSGDYLPTDQAGPVRPERANFRSAASQLIGAGFLDTSERIATLNKMLNEKPSSSRTSGITSVELGAAYADPSAYDPLDLVKTRGLTQAKDIYRRQYDNARALERITITNPEGISETTRTTRSRTGEGLSRDYGQVHKDVIAIEEDMRKVGISEMDDVLDSLDKYKEKHPKGLPGTGNLKNLPLANYLKEGEGQAITDQIARLESAIILKRAGLTQTASELERVKAMLARTVGHNAEDFLRAFGNLQSTYEKERSRLLGRAGPEAKKILSERMAINPDMAPWQERKNAKPVGSSIKQQLLEELRKNK